MQTFGLLGSEKANNNTNTQTHMRTKYKLKLDILLTFNIGRVITRRMESTRFNLPSGFEKQFKCESTSNPTAIKTQLPLSARC